MNNCRYYSYMRPFSHNTVYFLPSNQSKIPVEKNHFVQWWKNWALSIQIIAAFSILWHSGRWVCLLYPFERCDHFQVLPLEHNNQVTALLKKSIPLLHQGMKQSTAAWTASSKQCLSAYWKNLKQHPLIYMCTYKCQLLSTNCQNATTMSIQLSFQSPAARWPPNWQDLIIFPEFR